MGLRIGSLFAFNRALLFVRRWAFVVEQSARRVHVIKSIYSVDGHVTFHHSPDYNLYIIIFTTSLQQFYNFRQCLLT